MRLAAIVVSSALILSASPMAASADLSAGASSTLSATATEPVTTPNTPNGTGDPNARVCRAPQRIADSGQLGPEICGYNYEWLQMAMNGKDLGPDGKTLIAKPTVANPKGDGDPDAVTCRTPKFVFLGPLVEVCRTNRFWADLIKNHQFVDALGVVRPRPPASFASSSDASFNYHDNYGFAWQPGISPPPAANP